MKYYFVLGTNTALSVAEICQVFSGRDWQLLAQDFLVGELPASFDADQEIRKLGGVIKIGKIVTVIKSGNDRKLLEKIADIADQRLASTTGGKFNFGFSSYGKRYFNKKDYGLKLKKYFQDQEISSRFVVSRENTLSSVVVSQNKLLTRGVEIILAGDGDDILIGETLAVQPFKDLSLRDYGRPARDDLSGMLPPKLAQVMLNLSGKIDENTVIIDPFCGSGTVLTEALLMGCKKIFGSDISAVAIESSRKNLSWVREMYKIEAAEYKLFVKKAEQLSKFIKPESVNAIVTEPYLGPQRGKIEFQAVVRELEELYTIAIQEFYKILKPGGRVVMVWPLYYGERPISPSYEGFEIISVLPTELKNSQFIRISQRNTIVYGRPGQKVYREIIVLERK